MAPWIAYIQARVSVFTARRIGEMIKFLGWTMLGVIVIVAGFLYRYESLDPCEWLTQDLAVSAGLQPVRGLGDAAGFVMEPMECVERWAKLRIESAER